MNETSQAYEEIIHQFTSWAYSRPEIRGAIMIGSRARQDHPADEWSDLDIIFFTSEPETYTIDPGWLTNIGDVWLSFLEPAGGGGGPILERRAMFAGGLDVDFVPFPLEMLQSMETYGVPPDIADMLGRGVRVLLDKDGLVARLRAAVNLLGAPESPSRTEFLNVVNDFWYHTVWVAKHLRRGELWWAKSGCDSHLKELLRRMLEWQVRVLRGSSMDTWMRGRFLEEWADPRAVRALQAAFAHYDEEDVWRALFVTMDLFRWLSEETAAALSYPYPKSGAKNASGIVQKLFDGRETA